MMVFTAKCNLKKVLLILAAAAALILSLILLMGGNGPETGAPAMSSNAARVQFLKDLGWEVKPDPVQSGTVKIPTKTSSVYERYNNLQKSQGYNLSDYAGKKVQRYVYQVTNMSGASAPVYATMLIAKDQIIGGDITNTAPGGKVQGFKRSAAPKLPQPTEAAMPPVTTAPAEISH